MSRLLTLKMISGVPVEWGGGGCSCLTRELFTIHAGEQTLAFTVRSGDWSTVAKRGGAKEGGLWLSRRHHILTTVPQSTL